MKIVYNMLVLCAVCGCRGDDVDAEIEHRRMILEQLTKTRTVLLDGYHLVTRQVATDVFKFRSYRTVSVILYPMGRDVTEARFTFQSEELHMNNIGSCSPQDVVVNIKRGAYPAVNPDGYDFPKDFIDPATREKIHTLELLSDGRNITYSIKNPQPGNWYALVYKQWEDPRTQKVEQQGLVASCKTILYTDVQVKKEENIELVDCYDGITVNADNIPALFKCITIDSTEPISLNLTVFNTSLESPDILFRLRPWSLPTEEDCLISCAFNPRAANSLVITFTPNPRSWHYIQLEPVTGNVSKYADCESYYFRTDEEEIDNSTVLDLMRDDKGRFFTFDYGIPTADIQDSTSLVNLTSDVIKSLRFKINQFIDIGGSITIDASILMTELMYYMGYKREVKKGALLGFTEDKPFFRTVICLNIGHASIPLQSGHCKYNDQVKRALFVLNSTDSESIYDKIIIPFPESGEWYLTFRLFCDEVVCPCKTSHNGTKYYVNTSLDEEGSDLSGELSNSTREGESSCNATIVLSISSSSCNEGRCSNHGSCLLNTFGALVMSYCACYSGYGAWDCSDESRMDSMAYMLASVLLLTLSNLIFMFSIYVAIIRLYYTEAMMYAFTMIFSTFYHACDAPAQVALCITRGNILQFGDFYCGLMCFWVTLLAMSTISEKLTSSLQLIGAIIIALLTTWNMHSIVAFALPVALGVTILSLSWFVNYMKHRRFVYPRSYYTRYLPIGIVLVSVGLICYAFLQTEQNYRIVHSLWHMIIAMSVVFLLPDVKREGDYNPFVPSRKFCVFPKCKVFRSRLQRTLRSSPPTSSANAPLSPSHSPQEVVPSETRNNQA